MIRFNKEARESFLKFAISPEAKWKANFRDLNGAVIRMCTLAEGGRITNAVLDEEVSRLRLMWETADEGMNRGHLKYLKGVKQDELDYFDRIQLESVIKVCLESRSLSDAGRKLFAVSRKEKTAANDSDRLKKFLARFNLTWNDLKKDN